MRRPPVTRAVRLRAAAALVALTAAGAAGAHELGSAKITVQLTRDGRYRIDAALFPDHLPPGISGTSYDQAALRSQVLAAARIVFDGEAASPGQAAPDPAHPDQPTTPGGTPQMLLHFEGPVPGGARSVAWRLELPVGIYLFGTRDDDEQAVAFQWINGAETSQPVNLRHAPRAPSRAELARRYFGLGFARALPLGFGLALLALACVFPVPRPGAVAIQLATFAAAHAIGLGFVLSGIAALAPRIAMPLVALSVLYLALDNLIVERIRPSRLLTIFGFGLVYGAACAPALLGSGVRRAELSTAVTSFHLGGTVLQLVVAGLAFLAIGAWFGSKPWYRARLCRPGSALLAIAGLAWAIRELVPLGGAR